MTRPTAEPVHIRRALRAEALVKLAAITQPRLAAVHLLDDARQSGAIIPAFDEIAVLRAAAEEEGWKLGQELSSPHGLELVRRAAVLRDPESLRLLGEVALQGRFEDLATQEAVRYFKAAALAGNYGSWSRLGEIYERGDLLERDEITAFHCHRQYYEELVHRAATTHDHNAKRAYYLEIGNAAFEGAGFGFEHPEEAWGVARIWWLKAAQSERPYVAVIDPEALFRTAPNDDVAASALERLGMLCLYGLAVVESRQSALRLWRRASRRSPQARQQLIAVALKKYGHNSRRREVVRQFFLARALNSDSADAAWQRCREMVATNVDERAAQYEMAAKAGHAHGLLAHGLCQTLFARSFDMSETIALFQKAVHADVLIPIPTRRIMFDGAKLQTCRRQLVKLDRMVASVSPPGRVSPIWNSEVGCVDDFRSAFLASPEGLTEPLLEALELRQFLARVTGETSLREWQVVVKWAQIRSASLLQRLGGHPDQAEAAYLTAMAERICDATLDTGTELNPLDERGFRRPGRAVDRRNALRRAIDPGWDAIKKLRITCKGVRVLEAIPTPHRRQPLLTKEDLHVAMILALLEVHERGEKCPGPSFSLESLPQNGAETICFRVLRKEFSNPDWLGHTALGKSMYHADTLLFLSKTGFNLTSAADAFRTVSEVADWVQPEPWRRAEHCGGVRASTMGRNALVVDKRMTPLKVTSSGSGDNFSLDISIPTTLAHVDGSEEVFDKEGVELHRDGGRKQLRFQVVRHAAVLSTGVSQMSYAFPVFERTIILLGLVASLREALNGYRQHFARSKLMRLLEQRRSSYSKLAAERHEPFEDIVIWQ